MQNTIYQKLQDLLKSGAGYLDKDGELNLPLIQDKAYQGDADLLDLLLGNPAMQKQFFTQTAKALIFKRDSFIEFISDKNFFADSYTRYKNKIGLGDGKKYLKASQDVVLMFPFKDCVLEGGMSNEDEGKREIFYNETLALDEIDRLFEPKLLSNTKRITADGEQSATGFNRDENGDITDNLLIKGNNLLALHSLKTQFAGKVKLIYIDPPYNTGNDSFKYNDSFNHSTWLTFMKNRLEAARQLLSNDGVIFVHLDYNAVHYCKILMDEIFGKSNFINEIIWRRKQATSYGKNKFGITNDTMLFYSKNEDYTFYPIYSLEDENTKKYIKERFIFDDGDGRKYMKSPLVNSLYRPNLKYIFMGINPPDNGWLYSKERMTEFHNNGELLFPENKNSRIYRKIYLDTYKGQVIQNIWIDIPIVNPMAKEQTEFSTQKPEKLLERIIHSTTQQGDIILDFFAGSGTTAAVAHKMGRQYIAIEQMDYIETITKARLQKVIGTKTGTNLAGDTYDYDEGGISKSVNWKGGGEFIYTELASLNQILIDAITQADNVKTLLKIRERVLSTDFKQYQLNNEGAHDDEAFTALNLNDQKQALIAILDKNQLYANYSERADELFNCNKQDITISENFYEK